MRTIETRSDGCIPNCRSFFVDEQTHFVHLRLCHSLVPHLFMELFLHCAPTIWNTPEVTGLPILLYIITLAVKSQIKNADVTSLRNASLKEDCYLTAKEQTYVQYNYSPAGATSTLIYCVVQQEKPKPPA